MARLAEPPADAPALPRETGGFRLMRVLGRGGMGVVYEAEELASGRRVALKVLVKELSLSEEAFERFRREARIAASVSDPNCVFVFGAHVVEGAPAISMELCAGETLEHRIASGKPVPVEDAVKWTIEILDGLEAAHHAGVVHRDVKPSNCFTTAQGRVKVGDFGLSRSLEQDVQLTRSGVFLGSPLYASPEQVRGRAVDLRSDLYSVGATLYALLTGRSPYHGENLGEVLARILSEDPVPPSAVRKEVPRGLDKVVLRAMERDPDERYATHAELREALRPFLGTSTTAAGPLRRCVAYFADSWVVSLIQMPLIAVWSRFDPAGVRQHPEQIWRLQSPWLMLAMASLGLLYFGIAESVFHRTVAKWATGQRVVSVGEPRFGLPAGLLRAAVWFSPGILAVVIGLAFAGMPAWAGSAIPFGGSLLLLVTIRRRNGWRGVHELVSRTRVVVEPLPFARFARHRTPPAAKLESSDLFPPRFGAYATLGRVGRTASGEIFEASDTHLERRVWIHALDPAAPPLPAERRSLDRATRLRWLDGFVERGRRHEVYEAPGGASLLDCAAGEGRLAWPMAHSVLSALAEEVDRDPPPRISLEQVWIDRSWSLRILDEPHGEDLSPAREPLELLGVAARVSLGVPAHETGQLPPDLPMHAEPTARRLLGLEPPFASIAEARRSLSESANRPQRLDWKIRGLQLLLGSGIWLIFVFATTVSTRTIVLPQAREMMASAAAIEELRTGKAMRPEDLVSNSPVPTGPAIDAEGLRAREILVAQLEARFDRLGQGTTMRLTDEQRELVARTKERHRGASREAIDAARALVASSRPPGFGFERVPTVQLLRRTTYVLPFFWALLWTFVAVAGAFLLRGGISLRLASLAVRGSRGRRAGRWRCALRAFLSGLPFLVLYAFPWALCFRVGDLAGAFALGVAALAHLALIGISLRSPARGWHDRIAGTRLVPR